jgi:serine/threonine protein kinase
MKPENIMLSTTNEGHIRLVSFGAAKLLAEG